MTCILRVGACNLTACVDHLSGGSRTARPFGRVPSSLDRNHKHGRGSKADSPNRRTAWTILVVALLALVTAIALSPREHVFDEGYYIRYVDLLHRHGLSMGLLELLPGATGPLYGVVNFAIEPLTGLDPVRMRLATFALLLVAIALVAVGLNLLEISEPWLAAAAMLVVPMTWVQAGIALTGTPTLVFVAANLVMQLRGLAALDRGAAPMPWFIGAGALLGIEIAGRQTTSVLAVTPLLLPLIDRRLLAPVLVQAAIAALMALPLLIAWGGPVPPLDDTEAGLAPENALLSLGYLLVGFLLLAKPPHWLLRWPCLLSGIVLVGLNAWLEIAVVFPLASIADNLLSEPQMWAYGIVCGALLMWAGGAFLAWIAGETWRNRRDARQVLVLAGLVALSLAPALIGNQFSSRYTAMALPYLVLATAAHREPGMAANLKAALGCAFGLAALLSYYWGDLTSDLVRTL